MITRERLIEEFVLLDEKAQLMGAEKIDIFLIGGGNLALRGIKPATADVDIVLKNAKTLKQLEEVLTNPSPRLKTRKGLVIYVKVVEHEYTTKLGAVSVFKKLDPEMGDFNLDVFVKRVLKGIVLTEGIMRRSSIPEEFKSLRTIRVHLVSPEDIFLFKGVTSLGRSKDIDDILRLLEMGIDFNTVLREVEAQKEVIEPEWFEWFLGILLDKMTMVRNILQERGLRSSGLEMFIRTLQVIKPANKT
ncbi:hypothetical protein A3L09_10680 (plasmid) [Thermococcus profundus]|uniref:Nucleotidyltransferase n=1 Tax=Thermococcus profundus TaxID=49899 RepID=A0A2Z2MGG2_THEPR|nr:hypothetical protein [Thermococcus profundus]ASJ03815.1 hypothetical protein A3L09_10680 [Thermococcus profundus]